MIMRGTGPVVFCEFYNEQHDRLIELVELCPNAYVRFEYGPNNSCEVDVIQFVDNLDIECPYYDQICDFMGLRDDLGSYPLNT